MKKFTLISVILATAVMVNVTAQRRTSTRDESSNKKSATERRHSVKSESRKSSSDRTYTRSTPTRSSNSRSTSRKEITTPSRKVERNQASSRSSRSNNRSYNRTSSSADRSSSSNNGFSTQSRRSNEVPSRNSEVKRAPERESRTINRPNRNTQANRNHETKREVRSVNPPRNSETKNRRHAASQNRSHEPSSRAKVNLNREVRHYPTHRKYVRTKPKHVHVQKPRSVTYRAKHYPYRQPVYVNIRWTPRVYRHYCTIYPEIRRWRYHRSYVVHTVSAYDAYYHMGEVRRVYGKVMDSFYAYETDEYFLYIGAPYPYQDFTVVVPGYIARSYHRNPERFFYRNHINVTGLITSFDGEPEMVVKRHNQLDVY